MLRTPLTNATPTTVSPTRHMLIIALFVVPLQITTRVYSLLNTGGQSTLSVEIETFDRRTIFTTLITNYKLPGIFSDWTADRANSRRFDATGTCFQDKLARSIP